MNIRNATITDLADIVAIYNSTVASRMVTADTEPVTVESRLPWFYAHTPASRPLWVAELDGRIAGWISFQSFYGRPAYQSTVEVSIYVDEAYRRRQVGRSLLRAGIEKAPELGIETLLGFIFGHNEPSLHLFESFGFQRWGYLPQIAEMDRIKYDLAIYGRACSHY